MSLTSALIRRPRRNRKSHNIRRLTQESRLCGSDLIAPLFVIDGPGERQEIASMPGQYRLGLDHLLKEVEELRELGLAGVALFPVIPDAAKTPDAACALDPEGLYPNAIRALKKNFPDILLVTDVALDPYSSDGHDGLLDRETGEILNDQTLPILAQMAVLQARAGSDIIGASDMMDGRVAAIRQALDSEGYTGTSIMSYTAKYASAFYSPFREALASAPRSGDKKTYQMNPANVREAVRETLLDESEGADIVMAKPALCYLDVIRAMREATTLPIAAYNVSGEYAMVKAAAAKGLLDEEQAVREMLTSFKRAGCDIIFTYFAKQASRWFSERGL